MVNPTPDNESVTPKEIGLLRESIGDLKQTSASFVSTRELYIALLAFAGVIVGVVAFVVQMLLSNHVDIVARQVANELAPQLSAVSENVSAASTEQTRAATMLGSALAETEGRIGTRLDALEAELSNTAEGVRALAAEGRSELDIQPLGPDGAEQRPTAIRDIIDMASEAGTFTTLVAAFEAAGLVETLKGEGPFTVFAPTDDAFAALPEGTVEGLLADPEALSAILTYHVVPGKFTFDELSNGITATTVNGADVTIGTEGGMTINGANVITANIETRNGIIHVIDSVILPPQ